MGVHGTWEYLKKQKTEKVWNIAALSLEAFENNENGLRAFRLGVDASAWLFHCKARDYGRAPLVEALFQRLARYKRLGIALLLVLDGKDRPGLKRGKAIRGGIQEGELELCEFSEAFGFEWRRAPGEAEAELAYLNAAGKIDAVLSDDVDTFLFGARFLIRNNITEHERTKKRKELTAKAKNAGVATSDEQRHANGDEEEGGEGEEEEVTEDGVTRTVGSEEDLYLSKSDWQRSYSSTDIQLKAGLDRNAMIFIAVLSGGDYGKGLKGCGPDFALGLVACGFASQLCNLVRQKPPDFEERLAAWRERVKSELLTNASKSLPSKKPSLVKNMPDDFPNPNVVNLYLRPLTSATRQPRLDQVHGDFSWSHPMEIPKLAELMHSTFGDLKETVQAQLRSLIWEGALVEALRFRALGRTTSALPLLGVTGVSHLRRRGAIHDVKVRVDPTRWADKADSGLPAVETNTTIAAEQKAKDRQRYLDSLEAEGKEPSKKLKSPKEAVDPRDPRVITVPAAFLRLGAPEFYADHRSKIERLPRGKTKTPKGSQPAQDVAGLTEELDAQKVRRKEALQVSTQKKKERARSPSPASSASGRGATRPVASTPRPKASASQTPREVICVDSDEELEDLPPVPSTSTAVATRPAPSQSASIHDDSFDYTTLASQSVYGLLGRPRPPRPHSPPAPSDSQSKTGAKKTARRPAVTAAQALPQTPPRTGKGAHKISSIPSTGGSIDRYFSAAKRSATTAAGGGKEPATKKQRVVIEID